MVANEGKQTDGSVTRKGAEAMSDEEKMLMRD